jgi:hypothetical protein
MRDPDRPISDESLPQIISPFNTLNQAIKKVPALKYALGLAGIAAALAIIKTLVTDLRLAVFGMVVMLVLMTVLFVFAKLTAASAREIRLPAFALMWFSLLLTIASASLLFTSVFFAWPINLKRLVGPQTIQTEQASAESKPTTKTTYLRGVVRDLKTKEGIAGAVIELELLPSRTFTTTSDGGFSIDAIAADPGDSARVYVRKDGYVTGDEYVTLPGPKTIYLERKK